MTEADKREFERHARADAAARRRMRDRIAKLPSKEREEAIARLTNRVPDMVFEK